MVTPIVVTPCAWAFTIVEPDDHCRPANTELLALTGLVFASCTLLRGALIGGFREDFTMLPIQDLFGN